MQRRPSVERRYSSLIDGRTSAPAKEPSSVRLETIGVGGRDGCSAHCRSRRRWRFLPSPIDFDLQLCLFTTRTTLLTGKCVCLLHLIASSHSAKQATNTAHSQGLMDLRSGSTGVKLFAFARSQPPSGHGCKRLFFLRRCGPQRKTFVPSNRRSVSVVGHRLGWEKNPLCWLWLVCVCITPLACTSIGKRAGSRFRWASSPGPEFPRQLELLSLCAVMKV